MSLIFVDVGAGFNSPCPGIGDGMTEFGAVEFETRGWFHGKPYQWEIGNDGWQKGWQKPSLCGPWYETLLRFEYWLGRFKGRPIFVSDNPAYDWQWINYHFHHELSRNPFGYSARRIGDFYAGLVGDLRASSAWKKLRITLHDHNSVNDAMGNAEAFERILRGER